MPDDELRISRRTPADAVNLAWLVIPPLDILANISLVETGRLIAENLDLVWPETLSQAVIGTQVATESVTGLAYVTTYNAVPAATGTISSGIATYAVPREKTTAVTPSGFVIDNFTAQIRVLHPQENETGVWRLLVKDGLIQRRYVLRESDQSWLRNLFSTGDELQLYYSLPESLRIPAVLDGGSLEDNRVVAVSGKIAAVLDTHTIALPDADLYQVTSVRVNGEELVEDSSQYLVVDTPQTTAQLPPLGPFTAWDPVEGTLTLERSLSERDEVVASYQYRESLYLFEGYLDNDGVFHDLDLNPSPGHFYDNGRSTEELLNIPIYVYLLPTAAYRRADSGGNLTNERTIYSGTRWEESFLRWERTAAPIGNAELVTQDPCRQRHTFGHSYFGSATFVSDVPVDTLTPPSATGQVLANFPSAMVLAKIYVTSAAQVENVQILDTRQRGGGIPEDIRPTDTTLPPATRQEIETYWDNAGWDGMPVPLAGVLLVEVPAEILTGAAGYPQFDQAEVEAIVQAHVAAGIRPVIRYL